jgi:arginine exporter protein ArgO
VIAALGIGVPTSAHFIYIPVVLILGIVVGFIMGSKATRDAFAMEQRKVEERAARKAARAAAAGQPGTADTGKPPASSSAP